MSKRMLLSVDRDESRAAVIEDGQLVAIEIEPNNRNTCKGNIYRATVARVEPSLQSAFVDFGNDKQGFLPVGEIHPKLRGNNGDKRAPIQELLRAKQEFLVQVVRDEIGQKGATLSTFISLPGRYLVLIPESDQDKAGVSRKLSDEARDRIKKLTETMKIPDGFGLIVRTAGETATESELEKDLLYLTRQWEHITKRYDEAKGPTLLYAERTLAVRFVRDYFTKDIEEIVIDHDETAHEVKEFLGVLMPRSLAHVHRYAGDVPMFARYGIEGRVEDVFARQVYLPSGGSIVIDQTEALVSIDVNSGRVKEKDIEETARATNIEAAQEIAHQLILRDMGGLVVIDFIDMREKKYVREVETVLKDAFKNDKARTKLGHISEFGLLEMSRQRIKSSVNKGTFDSCPHCSGTGRIRSFESVAMSVLRRIYETVAQRRIRYVIATVPAPAARYLLNARRAELAGLEKQYHLTIEIIAVEGLPSTQVTIEHLEDVPVESGAERTETAKMLRINQEMDLVRNALIKREETRLQIEAAAARRGARVDYAEIYKEVKELSAPEPGAAAPAKTQRRKDTAGVAPEQAPIVETSDDDDVPPPRGLGHWFKTLFGLVEPSKPVIKPAAPALGAPAGSAPQGAALAGPTLVDGRGRSDRPDRPDRAEGAGRPDRPDRRDDRGRGNREGRPDRGGDRQRRPEGARSDAPRGDAARGDAPRSDAPRSDAPRSDAPRSDSARADGPPQEGGRSEAPRPEAAETVDQARPEAPRLEPVRSQAARPSAPAAPGSADSLAAEAAATEVAERRRRRRRRRGPGDRANGPAGSAGDEGNNAEDMGVGEEGVDAADGDGEHQAASAVPASAAVAATPAEVAVHPAEQAAPVTAEPELAEPELAEPEVAEPEVAAAEPAVDAKALMQEEIAKLMAETAATVSAEPTPTPAPAPVTANKRFVIDLRTPR